MVPRGGIEPPTLRFSVLIAGLKCVSCKFRKCMSFIKFEPDEARSATPDVPERSVNFRARLHRICTWLAIEPGMPDIQSSG